MQRDQRSDRLTLSATDLSSFLSCHHRTALEMSVAKGKFKRAEYDDPQLEALFRRGLEHEDEYVKALRAGGATTVCEIAKETPRDQALAETIAAIRRGDDVIVQGALGNEHWYGRPDILKRIAADKRPAGAEAPAYTHAAAHTHAAAYEVVDTKLSRETKAGTVLQLALYSELLADIQGHRPEYFHVVTPEKTETYRLDEYAAYFRLQRDRILEFVREEPGVERDEIQAAANYPEPVDYCDICAWAGPCDNRRRRDDHLSLVAGIARSQRRELTAHEIETMKALAEMAIQPLAFRPKRGADETLVRVREQARVQVEARESGGLVYELLPVVLPTEKASGQGLCRLPEPTPGDIFLDLEGDPFAGPTSGPAMLRGREYLFGVVTIVAGTKVPAYESVPAYIPFWAESEAEEKAAFEAVIDLIAAARAKHPGMHVYHYAPYEPSAFKRLMGRHATREQEMDAFLRSETFVDLYRVVRESLRAGVERYSIKNMEPFYGYVRDVDLKDARRHLQAMELAVENNLIGELKWEVKAAVEGYNRDDCVSTLRLRDWLETLRAGVNRGTNEGPLPRPELKTGEASDPLKERVQKIHALRGQLLGVDDEARRLLGYLLDFHRREDKAGWWEYFRLLELADEALLDEPNAVAGLEFVEVVAREKRSQIQRYRYPPQEMELRRKAKLKLKDKSSWGEVKRVDRVARTIDVLVGPSKSDLKPHSAFEHEHVPSGVLEDAIFAIGEAAINGAADPLALELLHRRPPASRDVLALEGSVLAIQGPPGTGKTYTGGRMICDLIAAGKKVGIAATGHKVIHNLLEAVGREAAKRALSVRLGHKRDESDDDDGAILVATDNDEALQALTSGKVNVLGGTAWLWARKDFAKSVDVLFVDEAGQVPLANALAMTAGARALVLLGDPQQLDHPGKGTHPDGVGVSALEHYLGPHKTMPEELGMFLADTWRFGAPICDFTSEVFYERKLKPTPTLDLDRQRLSGGPLDAGRGAGLFIVDVDHDGNRNGSDEEVEAVARLVAELTAPGSTWTDCDGATRQMTADDILIVSPYNVQVSRLQERLPAFHIGTVDKFQGKQAPVVIYSMATSRPEDAPRGLEFLYSLNRLNVATSRARCAAIIVANPRLFEPDCKTPRQIQLANALCRFREMATSV